MSEMTLATRLPEDQSPDALFRLGLRCSAPGDGRPADLVTAHALFDVAARRGSIEAKVYRHELGEEMDPEDIAQAQALARAWLAQT